jgi:DNA repair exonuclease SbcCD ATPase subunit
LQRAEAALAAEAAAREKAERSLAETTALARDLQTKIGHAELAKNEAIEALRQEREVVAQLRSDLVQREERLNEVLAQVRSAEQSAESFQTLLNDERQARKTAEKALQVAEAARDSAELLARTLSEETARSRRTEPARRPRAEPEVVAASTRRQRPAAAQVAAQAAEPEPVKWWLNTKPAAKRR